MVHGALCRVDGTVQPSWDLRPRPSALAGQDARRDPIAAALAFAAAARPPPRRPDRPRARARARASSSTPRGTAHIVFVTRATARRRTAACRAARAACDVRTRARRRARRRPSRSRSCRRGTRRWSLIARPTSARAARPRPVARVPRPTAGPRWTPPAVIASGQRRSATVELAPRRAVRAHAAARRRAPGESSGPARRSPAARPRVLNLSDDPNAAATGADMARAAGRPDPDRPTAIRRSSRWRLFGGGDRSTSNAWATRGTVAGVGQRVELVSGPARRRSCSSTPPRASAGPAPFQPAPLFLRSFDTRARALAPRAQRRRRPQQLVRRRPARSRTPRGRLHVARRHASGGAWTASCTRRTGTRRGPWFGKTTVLFRDDGARERRSSRSRLTARGAAVGSGVARWQTRRNVWAMPLRQARATTGRAPPERRRPAPARWQAPRLRSDDRRGRRRCPR